MESSNRSVAAHSVGHRQAGIGRPIAAFAFLLAQVVGFGAWTAAPAVAGGTPSHTEFFEGSASDLGFSSVTFTPDGSESYYRACRESATAFPVDPAGGTGTSMNDDDAVRVDLANGRFLSLYGARSTTLFVGTNGYVTFGTEDKEYQPGYAQHFDLPRVSPFFGDLDPRGQDSPPITWKQLPDRMVVTWKAIVARNTKVGDRESFQVELFFDGRIRITWLELHAAGALVGLSRGWGIPADFQQDDFSALPACPSCTHEVCEAGAGLAPTCGDCTTTVCAFDSFCCSDTWDAQCVEEARCFCPATCGCGNAEVNGLCTDPLAIVVPETCDDGNRDGGDGCGADCQAETCGDATVDPGEQCDDGNATNGDGCDSGCRLEGGYCAVTFGFYDFTNPVGELTQLQWHTLYSDADAVLATDLAALPCRSLVPSQSLEYVEGDDGLLKALDVSLTLGNKTLHGPMDVVECTFRLGAGLVGIGSDRIVPNLVSSSYSGSVESVQPRISVTAVACGVQQVCGDGSVQGTESCDDGNLVFASGERCRADCSFVPCGKPTDSAGANPLAKDALFTLRAAVGQGSCVPEVCDVDDNGKVLASDALRILRRAVGQDIALACPE